MSSKIRDSAKGQPCQLRVPNICSHDRETVVHCHVRLAAAGGIGLKPNDLIGLRACRTCHDWLDRRDGLDPWHEIRAELILMGMVRTLDALVREGVVEL